MSQCQCIDGAGGTNLNLYASANQAWMLITGNTAAELQLIDEGYATSDDRTWRIMSESGSLSFAQPTWGYGTINERAN